MEDFGCSLWLMPSGHAFDTLQKIIRKLHVSHDAPLFEPHVTLLGDLEGSKEDILTKAEPFCADIKPFTLALDGIASLNRWYQCLFIRVLETSELTELHEKAIKTFDVNPTERYVPHVSLLYGDYDQDEKERITRDMEEYPAKITIDRVRITSCRGTREPVDWYTVQEFSLIHPRK